MTTRSTIAIIVAGVISATLWVFFVPWQSNPQLAERAPEPPARSIDVLDVIPSEDDNFDTPATRFVPPAGDLDLVGVVVDPRGTAVSGATVWLAGENFYTPPSVAPPHETVTTNATGSFRFTGLAEGKLHVCCFAEGYSPAEPREVVVSTEQVQVVISLVRGHYYHGRVLFADGSPERAQVKIRASDEDQEWCAESDENGYFVIEGLAEEARLDLEVTAPIALNFSMWGVDLAELPAEIVLRGGDLQIIVDPPPGAPQFDVIECRWSGSHADLTTTLPVVAGQAWAHGLKDDLWDYRFTADSRFLQTGSILVKNGKVNVVEYAPRSRDLDVRVTDSDGSPIEGARIVVDPAREAATTNAEGVAVVSGLPNRGFFLRVRKAGFSPFDSKVDPIETSGEAIEVGLMESGAFRIFLRDEANEPVTKATVAVRRDGQFSGTLKRSVTEPGTYSMQDVPLGLHEFEVRWGSVKLAQFEQDSISGEVVELHVQVYRPLEVECVVSWNGEPVAGYIEGPSYDYRGRVIAGRRFKVQVPHPGYYTFFFRPEHEHTRFPLSKFIGYESPVELHYEAGEFVGRVLDESGEPLPCRGRLASARAVHRAVDDVEFTADEAGEFRVRLAPGRYEWRVRFGSLSNVLGGRVFPDRHFDFPNVTEDTYRVFPIERRKFRLAASNPDSVTIGFITDGEVTRLRAELVEKDEWIVNWPLGGTTGCVSADDYPPLEFEVGEEEIVSLRLEEGGHVQVTVVDEDGRPFHNYPFTVESASQELPHSPREERRTQDNEGPMYLVAGTYWITTTMPSGAAIERHAAVVVGETTTVTLP